MRILRTEMYFDSSELRGLDASESNPGVAVAFAMPDGGQTEGIGERLLLSWYAGPSLSEEMFDVFLDIALRGLSDQAAHDAWSQPVPVVLNKEHVKFLGDANIVVEQSPPEWATLKSLVARGSGITVGTMLGTLGLTYPLLFFTVPMGIIIVGAARGISKGLEGGLNQMIQRALRPRRRSGKR
jgi:hypothetical protein